MTSSADTQQLDESLKMASDLRAEFENATGPAREHAARRLYYAGTIALWDIVGAEALSLVYGEATAETDNVTGLELLAQRTWVASQVFPSDTSLDPYSLSSASTELRSMAKGDAPKALKRPPGRRGVLTNAYAESYREELHKTHLGISAARVLTLTTSSARAEAMRIAAQQLVVRPLNLPPGLFLFGVQSSGADPLSVRFQNADGQETPLLRTS